MVIMANNNSGPHKKAWSANVEIFQGIEKLNLTKTRRNLSLFAKR